MFKNINLMMIFNLDSFEAAHFSLESRSELKNKVKIKDHKVTLSGCFLMFTFYSQLPLFSLFLCPFCYLKKTCTLDGAGPELNRLRWQVLNEP